MLLGRYGFKYGARFNLISKQSNHHLNVSKVRMISTSAVSITTSFSASFQNNPLNRDLKAFALDTFRLDSDNRYEDDKSRLFFLATKYPKFFVNSDVFNNGETIVPILTSPLPIIDSSDAKPYLMHPNIESVDAEVIQTLQELGVFSTPRELQHFKSLNLLSVVGIANATRSFIESPDKLKMLGLLAPAFSIVGEKSERMKTVDEMRTYHEEILAIFHEEGRFREIIDDQSLSVEYRIFAKVKEELVQLYECDEPLLQEKMGAMLKAFNAKFSSMVYQNIMNRKPLSFLPYVDYQNYSMRKTACADLSPIQEVTNLLLGIPSFSSNLYIKPELTVLNAFGVLSINNVNTVTRTFSEWNRLFESSSTHFTDVDFQKKATNLSEAQQSILPNLSGIRSLSYSKRQDVDECFYSEGYHHVKNVMSMIQSYINIHDSIDLKDRERESLEIMFRLSAIANPLWRTVFAGKDHGQGASKWGSDVFLVKPAMGEFYRW